MSITFATALLGLVLGVHPVELVVHGDVARVELLLDGELVGQRTEPPWEIPCDFGEALSPHELVAVAWDADGKEVGRVGQWVNFPRFASSRAEVTLDRGTALLDRTPIAVEVDRRGRTLDAQSLADRFTVEGRPVTAVAVEKGPAEVVVVMDRAAQDGFLEMAGFSPSRREEGRPITEAPIDHTIPSWPHPGDLLSRGGDSAVGAMDRRREHLETDMRLEEDQRLRFLWPHQEAVEEDGDDAVRPALFQHTRGLSPKYGGMLWLLAVANQPVFSPEEQRLSDAVAAAGLTTAVSGRRRAVILILSEHPSDASRLSPPAVRSYLEDLGVPLHVWAVGPVPDEVAEAWGGVREVPKKRELRRAVKELSKSLERQQIVWLDGLFLPQEVALTGEGDLHLMR
jgi:hypothetical protein